MNARPVFAKETRPHDCWDWITAEDVVRHALAAYYHACRSSKPPPGERFIDALGSAWTSREGWANNVIDHFDLRLKTDAYRLGIGDYEREARMLSRIEHPGVQPTQGQAESKTSFQAQHLAGVAP